MFINEQSCIQFTNAIRNYKKVWNEKLLKYGNDAIHDWTSHAADMLRYTAIIYESMKNTEIYDGDGQQFPAMKRMIERSKNGTSRGYWPS
jgi:hypothetical protein